MFWTLIAIIVCIIQLAINHVPFCDNSSIFILIVFKLYLSFLHISFILPTGLQILCGLHFFVFLMVPGLKSLTNLVGWVELGIKRTDMLICILYSFVSVARQHFFLWASQDWAAPSPSGSYFKPCHYPADHGAREDLEHSILGLAKCSLLR